MILASGGIPLMKLRSDEMARLDAAARTQGLSLRELIHQRLSVPGAGLEAPSGPTLDLDPEVVQAVALKAVVVGEASTDDWLRAVLLP